MKYIEHTTKTGKKIRVWDDLVPYSNMTEILYLLRNEQYPLVPQSDTVLEDFGGKYGFGKTILEKSFLKDLINNIGGVDVFQLVTYLQRCDPINTWINLYTGHDVARYHTDNVYNSSDEDYVTLLYYANIKWDINWDGGTIFRSDNLEDIEFVSDYKPGRLVLFDSTIPHKIMQTSNSAQHYRFTISSIYKNRNFIK